tara:strand:- start:701 stop:1156 length:456 start_codon:yes stop_codon:yes gene_type:complete
MDRNAILSGYVSNFSSYSTSDSRPTVEKVLKYSGTSSDILKRGDIIKEIVVFRLLGGATNYRLDAEKPDELNQNFEALVYVEQADGHSMKDVAYDRVLEVTDQLIDWANQVSGSDINTKVFTVTTTNVGALDERNGYIAASVSFQSIIQIS